MKDASLVVMAAGLGSRFGGLKQLARVGPGRESILDYTIYDALTAGVKEVILIVRNEILKEMSEHIRQVHGDAAAFTFVCQDDFGPPRNKPWGTVHAVLSAAHAVTSPFILANADDYYGTSSFQKAFDQLGSLSKDRGLLVAFELGKTLSAHGVVTRGLCSVEDGFLIRIEETSNLHRRIDGTIGTGIDTPAFNEKTPVSMNLWAFDHSILEALRTRWETFYNANRTESEAECLLPTEISALMNDGFKVKLESSAETWTGLTNPADLDTVRGVLAHLRP